MAELFLLGSLKGEPGSDGGTDEEVALRVTDGTETPEAIKTLVSDAVADPADPLGVAAKQRTLSPVFGPTDPVASIAAGNEYVWFKTDGNGTVLDILSGKA